MKIKNNILVFQNKENSNKNNYLLCFVRYPNKGKKIMFHSIINGILLYKFIFHSIYILQSVRNSPQSNKEINTVLNTLQLENYLSRKG